MAQLPWELVGIIIAIVGAWSALLIGVIKWFLNRNQDDLKEQLTALKTSIDGHRDEVHRIDKDILTLRLELARDYVRREDAIREQVVINAKLDALNAKIDGLRRAYAS